MGHSGSRNYGNFYDYTPGSVAPGEIRSTINFDVDPRDHIGDEIVGDSFTVPPVLYDRGSRICVTGVGWFGKHYRVTEQYSASRCIDAR